MVREVRRLSLDRKIHQDNYCVYIREVDKLFLTKLMFVLKQTTFKNEVNGF